MLDIDLIVALERFLFRNMYTYVFCVNKIIFAIHK